MPPPAADIHPRWLLPLACALFFGSGFAALIYQVVWLRSLSLVFGVTVYAASTVLAGFMAGLAIGSVAGGRLATATRHPFAVFGLVEIGVGLTALAVPLLVGLLERGYVAIHPALPESLAIITAVRFVAASAVLIVPASLMGATLPILVRATSAAGGVGSKMAALYATNTAGAIAGALIAGFHLVPALGLARASLVAAAVNGLVACMAFALAATSPRTAPPSQADHPAVALPVALGATSRHVVLGVFIASGVLSLALEVIWFRLLTLHLRPTAYAFTVMLAAVLTGISLGSYAVTPWLDRDRAWLAVLSALQLAIALVAVLSLNLLPATAWTQAALAPLLRTLGVDPYVWPLVASSAVSILPTSLLLGAAFPVGLRLWVSDPARASRQVSTFYAANVCGAIGGAVLGGFVLLPALGSRGALIAVSALALVSSVALASRLWDSRPNVAGFLTMVGPVAFVMASLNALDPFDDLLRRVLRPERLLWLDEGVQTTVSVHRRLGNRVMYLDGMHQADDSEPTAFTHHRIGALPMMLHPDPRRVLVVGLGGGATAGAAARFPNAQVDVVELSAEVVRGSAFFGAINFDVLTRHNVRLRVDDGRNFLLTNRQHYDVVTADIIHTTHAGAATVYSREYFELVRRALAPGGVVMQWIGAGGEFEYKLLLRTFLSVFPETTVWGDGALLLGSVTPLRLSQERFEQRRRDSDFRAVFDWDLATIQRLYVAGPDALRALAGEGPVLTDDRPLIEYFLSMPTPVQRIDLSGLRGRFDDILTP